MKEVPILFPLGISFTFTLFSSVFFPSIKFIAFAPFLALLFYRFPLPSCLWIASLCGLLLDLLSSEMRLGVFALNYCLTTLILYHQRHHFFEDKPLSLCLFTWLICLISTPLQWLLTSFFGAPFRFSGKLLATDLFILPLVDVCYAFIALCCPMLLYAHIKKIGWHAFYKTVIQLRLKKAE